MSMLHKNGGIGSRHYKISLFLLTSKKLTDLRFSFWRRIRRRCGEAYAMSFVRPQHSRQLGGQMDISQFLESAPRGAVYFSLGSNVRSDSLDARVCRIFLDAFAELSGYHVLWKWESDSLPAQPANVKIYKWMPQYDILRHPKVKVFITQGGLQSTEEAIHCGVPLIGIPFYADQDYNVKRIVEKGIGLEVDITQISKDILLEALRTILDDRSFQRNARQLSALMRDRMTPPLERAVWWTEYVLRHRGAVHLRTAAVDMPWYQYLLLDVLAFLLATTLLVLLLLWTAAKFVHRRMVLLAAPKIKNN